MIASKHLNKIIAVLVIITLVLSITLIYWPASTASATEVLYESKLFGDKIVTIDITVNKADWQDLLSNPTDKEYISSELTINGEVFGLVGIRTKGNSSLTQVAQQKDSDRYSLQFKFDQFQSGQTYYGLDSFCINNIVGDNTYMKDYISYKIMNFIGVPTPLTNYAKVTVNGEDYGFFVTIERYERSFLARNYETSAGQLYNVKTSMGANKELNIIDNNELTKGGEAGRNNVGNIRGAFQGGFSGSGGGGDLVYTDDSVSSYPNILNNAEFKKNSDTDKQRVITAIKNLNEGTNLEKYFNVDEILRYLAAHTVLVNLDSYSSNMAQNYYIYELDGKISILPWDYGLAFGGFQGGTASSMINFPIDTPVSGVTMESRPLINKLLEVDKYKEKYHQYLQEIVDGYFKSGLYEETITNLDNMINEYIKNDSTSFTTYEAYTKSLDILKRIGTLRAESIEGQLKGTIPSTTEGQSLNKAALISDEGINLSDLGSFMGGGGNMGGDRPNQGFDNSEMPNMPNFENRERGDFNRGDFNPDNFDGGDFNPGDFPGNFSVPSNRDSLGDKIEPSKTVIYLLYTVILLTIAIAVIYFFSRRRGNY